MIRILIDDIVAEFGDGKLTLEQMWQKIADLLDDGGQPSLELVPAEQFAAT